LDSSRYNSDANIVGESFLQKNPGRIQAGKPGDNQKITSVQKRAQAARGLSSNMARKEKIITKRK